MKKIDFHIHTIPVDDKDANFDFNLEKFQEYINILSIDAIAITNHNLFDLEQFKEIKNTLQNVIVFPGIEIDFESGHLLLIGENDNLEDFNQKCELIKNEFKSGNKIVTDRLKEIFVDLGNYLLIPHYDKKPKVSENAINLLKEYIFVGEVQSPKKFNHIIKESGSLTPVLFSDVRISTNLDLAKHQAKQTFIKTNSNPLTFKTVKAALGDKDKVFLSNTGKHGFFQVFNDGQELSNGLNVVLGGRSSGKTFLLNQLENIFNMEEKSVKYIRQFDLVKEDEKKFNETLENEKSEIREKYLQEFKMVVEDATKIDRRGTAYKLEKYIETLLVFASSEKLHDEFCRAALFTEIPFKIRNDLDLKELIKAVIVLLENKTYVTTINKHIPANNLKNLLVDLEKQYREKEEERLKEKWVNQLILDIGQQLKNKSASPNIEYNDIDFYDIKIEKERTKRFNAIAKSLKVERIIDENKSFSKFKIQAIAGKYNKAGELHEESHRQIKFTPAFEKYNSPINFLEKLKDIDGLEKTELYKYFCKITYQVLNEYGKKVSGGERAEFNLLKALQDARQYEMLLVDEPESSFDNLFLKENVNDVIKEISKELPVVVVTHNNTVGMLMHPDYILYTQRKIIKGKDEYRTFSGSPGDKVFKTVDGTETVSGHSTLLDALEAGEEAYNTRGGLYNSYK